MGYADTQRLQMIYGIPIAGVFEGKKVNRFPRQVWVYPIPIACRFRGRTVYRFPRMILAGKPVIVSREEGRNLGKDAPKKTGRPKIYATDAERKRAYRQRKGIRERGIYGQRFSRHKPKRRD